MADDEKKDELLSRAARLQQQADKDSTQNDSSAAERIIGQSVWMQKITAISMKIKNVLGPIGSLLAWLIGLIAKWFRWAAFEATDAVTQGDFSDTQFSAKRLLRNTLLSIVVLFLLQVAFSAAYYYGTYFGETVYVTGKQEIVTGELYQFGGCTSLPCSTDTDNGKFYLIESSLYFPIMYYPEENVFANIPQQDAACRVEGYGFYFRTLRWIYKSLQLYQHVVNVSCRPYTDEETRRAVRDGEILPEG